VVYALYGYRRSAFAVPADKPPGAKPPTLKPKLG
jgi:hypothetical protein